jgi:hypothetical protein
VKKEPAGESLTDPTAPLRGRAEESGGAPPPRRPLTTVAIGTGRAVLEGIFTRPRRVGAELVMTRTRRKARAAYCIVYFIYHVKL